MDYVFDLLQSKGGKAKLRDILQQAVNDGYWARAVAGAIWQWDEAGIMKANDERVCFTKDYEKLIA